MKAPMPFSEDERPPASAPREEQMAALLGVRALYATPPASRSVEARQVAIERVFLAELAIAATTAELDCESERADQAAAFILRQKSTEVQWLTLGSIAAATLTGIAGVFLSTKDASDGAQLGVAAGGGALTAGLGVSTLYVAPHIAFEHRRRLLGDVWRGPIVTDTYPSIVWAYLTRGEFSNDQRGSIREKIVSRWTRFDAIAHDPEATALLFGTGGTYDAETLRTRAAMLDQVKAEVALENQDLAALAAALMH
jgi:hypothetical protein